jgi:hypothetical protein
VIIAVVAVASILAVSAVTFVALSPVSSPRTISSPAAERVELPHTAAFFGVLADWSLAPATDLGAVLPAVGDASDGNVTLRIEAPHVATPTTAASALVRVTPGSTYELSASARHVGERPSAPHALIDLGSATLAFPVLGSEWSRVSTTLTIPAGVEELPLRVLVDGPVSALELDDVVLIAGDSGENVVPNPSFEFVDAAPGIVNESLMLRTAAATLAVAGPSGPTSWTITSASGTGTGSTVVSGTLDKASGVEAIALEGIAQGYYTATVVNAEGTVFQTPIAVIDGVDFLASPDVRFGATVHIDRPQYTAAPRLLASVGYGIGRTDVEWRKNEIVAGQYDFLPEYDSDFATLRASGVDLLAIIDYWNVHYDGAKTPSSAAGLAAFGAYAAEVVRRYEPAAIEVYNEFNAPRFNKGACGTGPDCYAQMLTAVDAALAASGGLGATEVVAGATALYDRGWFAGLWMAGGLDLATAMSFHPYEVYNEPASIGAIVLDAKAESLAAGREMPIWVTELGWTTTQSTTQGQQADNLVKSEIAALAGGAARFFWYELIDGTGIENDHEGNFGIFQQPSAGVGANQPKLAALTQAILIEALHGREFLSHDDLGAGATSAVFGTPGDEIRVAWATADSSVITLDLGSDVTVTGVDGSVQSVAAIDGAVTLELTSSPVIIEPAS